MAKKVINSWGVISYCKRNNLFTAGDMEQYSTVLAAADDETTPIHDIAVMIWICSDTKKSVNDIESDLVKEAE